MIISHGLLGFPIHFSIKYRLKCLLLTLMVKQSTRWRQTPAGTGADILQSDSRLGGIVYLWTEGCTQSPTTRLWLERVCLVPHVSKACIHLCGRPYNACLMKSPVESEGVGPHAYSWRSVAQEPLLPRAHAGVSYPYTFSSGLIIIIQDYLWLSWMRYDVPGCVTWPWRSLDWTRRQIKVVADRHKVPVSFLSPLVQARCFSWCVSIATLLTSRCDRCSGLVAMVTCRDIRAELWVAVVTTPPGSAAIPAEPTGRNTTMSGGFFCLFGVIFVLVCVCECMCVFISR